jgi:DNA adenine methylase
MILPLMITSRQWTYCEPFVGSGAMAADTLPVLGDNNRVMLNDKDLWLVCLWNAIKSDPECLIEKVLQYNPSPASFYEYKEQDGSLIDPVEAGFRKLVLHYITYSGLGVMCGGPLGGKTQSSSTSRIGCRWNPERIVANIGAWNRQFKRLNVSITNRDFSVALKVISPHSFVYLDPPYYEKGDVLYKHSMSEEDHNRLSCALRDARYVWLLSYNDHPVIRTLYSWAHITSYQSTYTAGFSNGVRRKNNELLITR